jgi:hypothetical protein
MRVRHAVVAAAAVLMLLAAALPAFAGGYLERAQARLNSLGCAAGTADGVADEQLRAAVIRFQAVSRLRQTGRLGATTRERLHSATAKRCDDRAIPARSGTGRRIVLSQRQNWVWLVRADGTVKTQGGMVDNDWLPQRTYYTGAQCGRPGRARYNGDLSGRLWLYYFVRFADCNVGFHQIPVRRSDGRQVHASWYAGTDLRESAGCIRLDRRMSRAVWNFTESRTKVVVVEG